MSSPRPWHRSLIFWLGLPGLFFLLWVWLVFNGMWKVDWTRTYTSNMIGCRRGSIILTHNTIKASDPNARRGFDPVQLGFHQLHVPDFYRRRTFFAALSWKVAATPDPSDPYFRTSELTLPLWLLTPLYLAAWLASIVWWQRGRARLMESEASAVSPTSVP